MSIISQLSDTTQQSKIIIFYPTHIFIPEDNDINVVQEQTLVATRTLSSTTVSDSSEFLASSTIQIRDNDTIFQTIKAQ
tara:strand:- start:1364 stop:1600 length:237 start_codon:yes stop_codon:yes gene_type:complete